MPHYVVSLVCDALNSVRKPLNGSRVLVLGVAYKPDVQDTRESPSFEVMRRLLAREGDVVFCDPRVAEVELDDRQHGSVPWSAEEVEAADCVVVLTAHREFLAEPLWQHARLVVDTRNVVPDGANVTRI
jgi:UDP-N-acetyl-D-glucosamine dehydrogenase